MINVAFTSGENVEAADLLPDAVLERGLYIEDDNMDIAGWRGGSSVETNS
jgi:hypothetical protein